MISVVKSVLAFDFGGTKIAVGLADSKDGRWVGTRRRRSPPDAQACIETAIGLAQELIDWSGMSVSAIGVSFGGHIDSTTGIVRRSLQVPGWENVALAKILSEEFHAPASIRNDAAAGAIGEWTSGAGKGLTDFLYVTVSTGVGGGMILNNKPYDGVTGYAGEFGHLPITGATNICNCGRIGCLESVASGPAIASRAIAQLSLGSNSVLKLHHASVTGEDVSAAAEIGDRLACDVLADAGRGLGEVLSFLSISLNPQAVLIGGGVAHAAEPFWSALERSMNSLLDEERRVQVAVAANIDDAPLYGALAIGANLAHTK